MDNTIENMINSIDLSAPVPEYEPMRQYYYLKACRQIVKAKEERLKRPLKAVVSTFGCQMNARDSEKLLAYLRILDMKNLIMKRVLILLYIIHVQ